MQKFFQVATASINQNRIVWIKQKIMITSCFETKPCLNQWLYQIRVSDNSLLERRDENLTNFKSSCSCRSFWEKQSCPGLSSPTPAQSLVARPHTDQWYDVSALNGQQRSSAPPLPWRAAYQSPECPDISAIIEYLCYIAKILNIYTKVSQ